jgi:acyl-coenzyme A thioesterase PaaI-like protein
MESMRVRPDANNCFVCGPDNPIGLRIVFAIDGQRCRGEFTPQPNHCGFDGMTHGGIIYSALDDVMANWLFLQGARAYTAKCEIRYREPLAVEATVELTCEMKRRKGRLVVLGSAAIRKSDQTVVAEAEASFMIEEFGDLN